MKPSHNTLLHNIIFGAIVGILVIPQSLGYATLAGLPPVVGLYTAILPAIIYAMSGTSHILAVGPVAITAMITLGTLSAHANDDPVFIAGLLAVMTGVILCLAGLIRLGWVVRFVSQSVSAGFVSGAAILIVLSQLKHLFGTDIVGSTLGEIITKTPSTAWLSPHLPTTLIGLLAFAILVINRYGKTWLYAKVPQALKTPLSQSLPLIIVIIAIILSRHYDWHSLGIPVLSALPSGMPSLNRELFYATPSKIISLMPDALLMSLIVFVSSIAVAKNLATAQHPVNANRELTALGLSNLGSGLSGGFAVAGGLSRTSLNMAVGVNHQLAGAVSGMTVLAVLVFGTRLLAGLPYAILGAIIASSALSMIDFKPYFQALKSSKTDAVAYAATLVVTCVSGLNMGLTLGLLASFLGMIYLSHKVHIAVIGQVGNSEHFRNVERHTVTTFDNLLIVRIDESLHFGNSDSVYQALIDLCQEQQHIILVMCAVNHIDSTAQAMLIRLNQYLTTQQKTLHLTEVKGPVMDTLKHSEVLDKLSGQVFLSTKLAVDTLKDG